MELLTVIAIIVVVIFGGYIGAAIILKDRGTIESSADKISGADYKVYKYIVEYETGMGRAYQKVECHYWQEGDSAYEFIRDGNEVAVFPIDRVYCFYEDKSNE